MIIDAAVIVLLTLIAYAIYRYGAPGKPALHKRFILGALVAGLAVAWCDVSDAEVGGGGSGSVLTLFRLIHISIIAALAGACYGGYRIIQMAPPRRRVPLAWVIGLYLLIYLCINGYHFYAEASAVRCDDPGASAPRKAEAKDLVTASIMYQRICDKGETDLRARFARLLHHETAKDAHAPRP